MASNAFGDIFRITTFGESHGPAIGVVIDGCPADVPVCMVSLQSFMARRAPGRSSLVSPRKERDQVTCLSGIFEGKTTGHPIALLIDNQDADSKPYQALQSILRPGHANYTYIEKYGIFDHRGGGRASARETAARVAAAGIAKQVLSQAQIECIAYLQQVGSSIMPSQEQESIEMLREQMAKSTLCCPDAASETAFIEEIERVRVAGNSIGGIVAWQTSHLPVGLGDPIYDKLEAKLALAMLSIPACKGFEVGSGFSSASMTGAVHNDTYTDYGKTASNHAGGVLGGVSNGNVLYGRCAFKPTSSIRLAQLTTDLSGQPLQWQLPPGSRHDPCVAVRAVVVVEAMLALVLVDALLKKQTNRLI